MIGLIGSRGIIGSAIHQRLRSDKKDLCLFGRGAPSSAYLNLDEPDKITPEILKGVKTLIHAAGVRDEDFAADPLKAYQKGSYATSKLLDAGISAGIDTFIYISTAHVYGPLSKGIDENTPAGPISDYACAHYISEQIFKRAITKNPNARILILRPCAVYGLPENLDHFIRWGLVPYRLPHMAATEGKIVLRKGSDQIYRNFVSAQCIANVIGDFIDQAAPGSVLTVNPMGHLDASILDFGKICADVYKDITGQDCPVTLDDSAAAIPFVPPLKYSTIHPITYNQGEKVETFIKSLIERCLNTKDVYDINAKV